MPIRKPRRQSLQELAYPPVPAIGGKDLRADEELLGLKDWEFGDHSTRYPQSLLSSSFDGSRWGGSTVGGSMVGGSSAGPNGRPRLSLGVPSSVGSPKKSSTSTGTSPTRSEVVHQVKRKKPPSADLEPSTVSSNPSAAPSTASSSPPKTTSALNSSVDGVVRPGDIVPLDFSAAALSVIGSTPAPVLPLAPPSAPPAPAPIPVPAPVPAQTPASSSAHVPASHKPSNRRTSQPPPRAPPSAYSHSHSHSYAQPLISVPTLPPIAASPRSSVADAVHPVPAGRIHDAPAQAALVPPLRIANISSTLPQGASSMTLQTALKQVVPSPSNYSASTRLVQAPLPVSTRTEPQVPKHSTNTSSVQPQFQLRPSALSGSTSTNLGSQATRRSPQRALPVPPPQSVVSAANPAPPPIAQAFLPPQQSSSIHAWRTGVSSGPRGWGAPPLPPSAQPTPHPPPHPRSQLPSAPVSTQPLGQYQPPSLPTRGHYQAPAPPPTRSYSYDVPAGRSSLTTQIATNSDGSTSTPDLSGGNHDLYSNSPADDGKPGLQRGPSKLRRKLTKNRGWVPNAPAAAAPALSAPATSSTSSALALATRSQLAPPATQTRPAPRVRVIPSGGQALVPAQRAFIGTHRLAQERILWGLPLDRDPRVRHAITKIESIKDAIATFGVEQFVETRMRGAVICNVDYRPKDHPNDLAFDWITYKDAQKTLEPTLQKAITRIDPATAVLVVIFLLSPSMNSLAIWRKSLTIAPGLLDPALTLRVARVKRQTADQEGDMTFKTQ
ncbi:hypothetical protein CTheo_8550 [Ceratobasidium theobromae]|uniref:CcmS related domain-containing protein n=1 Tax=Ceratobasidium theobromae TaxID=1582974 RepID=A0A5N5Q9A9_9AGAM|nr:hypothetical protein CTheo_8550 [Ceratobasidium theobromae]